MNPKPSVDVPRLDLCEELKRLGFDQKDAHFAYFFNAGKCTGAIVDNEMYSDVDDDYRESKLVAAPTYPELFSRLPKIIEVDKNKPDEWFYLTIFCDHAINWCVEYRGIDRDLYADNSDDSLADTLARMTIELTKQGHIKP